MMRLLVGLLLAFVSTAPVANAQEEITNPCRAAWYFEEYDGIVYTFQQIEAEADSQGDMVVTLEDETASGGCGPLILLIVRNGEVVAEFREWVPGLFVDAGEPFFFDPLVSVGGQHVYHEGYFPQWPFANKPGGTVTLQEILDFADTSPILVVGLNPYSLSLEETGGVPLYEVMIIVRPFSSDPLAMFLYLGHGLFSELQSAVQTVSF